MPRSSLDEKMGISTPNYDEEHKKSPPPLNTDFDLEANIHKSTLLPSPTFPPSEISTSTLLLYKFLSYPIPGSVKIKPTSYLDGVRGVAALTVYIFHALGLWGSIVPAWHADRNQTSLLQFPFLRTIFVGGGAAVAVFFALSGYVLTHRCLKFIRSQDVNEKRKVAPSVYSSMFRRGFRLYLPVVITTFVEMLSTRFGYAPPLTFDFVAEGTFAAQFIDWVSETNRLINPRYNFIPSIRGLVMHPKYEPVVWTIPIEFYGSFLCYFLLLFLSNFPGNKFRMLFVAAFALLMMGLGSWNSFCFAGGMLIADFNLGQEERAGQVRGGRRWWVLFVVAFYVAGFPTLVYPEGWKNGMPGFETLRSLIPVFLTMEDHARWWWSISGVSLLLSISQIPKLKRFFETDLCQYLGKVSFSLYLVHEFCILLFGLPLQHWMIHIVLGYQGKDNKIMYWIICVVWFWIFTIGVCGVAALVTKWVDGPSVRVARWAESRVFGSRK